jgi:hypothetical protein
MKRVAVFGNAGGGRLKEVPHAREEKQKRPESKPVFA